MSGTAGLSGLRKAAILMVALGEEVSTRVMGHFRDAELRRLAGEISRLDAVDPEVRDAVLEEYQSMVLAVRGVDRGGPDLARRLVSGARPGAPAEALLEGLGPEEEETSPLTEIPSARLGRALLEEPAQTIALVLAQLPRERAAATLAALPAGRHAEVARRISELDEVSPAIAREVAQMMGQRLEAETEEEVQRLDGLATAGEILSRMPRSRRKAVIEGVEKEDGELAEQLRERAFTFEEVLSLEDKDVQELLKNIETRRLASALKGATEAMQDLFTRNMSQRAASMLREEMEFLGGVKVQEVEEAQKEILQVVVRLEEEGVISMSDEAEDHVVP